jgi:hypothetical protein
MMDEQWTYVYKILQTNLPTALSEKERCTPTLEKDLDYFKKLQNNSLLFETKYQTF